MHFLKCCNAVVRQLLLLAFCDKTGGFREIAVSLAIGKMSGCITTENPAAHHSELVGSETGRIAFLKR